MREGRLHKGKPEDIPQAGERHPFSRAVRSTESAMQENREREEDGSLSFLRILKRNRAGEKSRRDFLWYCVQISHEMLWECDASSHRFHCLDVAIPSEPRERILLLKATRGRVRTPKASRNPAQQPDFVTALLSVYTSPGAIQCGAVQCNFLKRLVRIEKDCDRAFIDQFY